MLKFNIDNSIFSKFTLSHKSSECKLPGEETISVYRVPEGTYFDESVVIDEYKLNDVIVQIDNIDELINTINNSTEDIHILLTTNQTLSNQIVINNGNKVILDLNPNIIINSEGNIGDNGRLFQVNNGTLIINGNGAKIIASSDSYGAFRVESEGNLQLNNVTLENSKSFGLNVKVLGGEAILNNVSINSNMGGGIEVTEANLGTHSKQGIATLNNCNFTQSGYYDHCSTCLSVSGNSILTINNGTYISENWALYVFSSGGKIVINGGAFKGNKNNECMRAAIDTKTYPNYEGGFVINNGNFTGNAYITTPAYLIINKGTFTFNPEIYVDLNKHSITENNGKYIVK